jgi:hypothetical protein
MAATLSRDTDPRVNAAAEPLGPDINGQLTLLRNDEIDIEIPTNGPPVACEASGFSDYKGGSAQMSGAAAPMGWNTMNCNSYSYTSGGGSGSIPYVNIPIVSDEPIVDGEKYHVYGFQWVSGHMGSGRKGGAPPDPANPDTWEVRPHINFYMDGAFMCTANAFVPTHYSRFTIGFIATGGDPSTWRGQADDWAENCVATYISEVRIEPFHNDRDSWWPMTDDQPVNVRFPRAPLGNQLWAPLDQVIVASPGAAANLDASGALPITEPYYGAMTLYGFSCGGAAGMKALTSRDGGANAAAFEAWVAKWCTPPSGTVHRDARSWIAAQKSRLAQARMGPTGRYADVGDDVAKAAGSFYATVFMKGDERGCTSGVWYGCRNLGAEMPPPPCSFINEEQPRSLRPQLSRSGPMAVSGDMTSQSASWTLGDGQQALNWHHRGTWGPAFDPTSTSGNRSSVVCDVCMPDNAPCATDAQCMARATRCGTALADGSGVLLSDWSVLSSYCDADRGRCKTHIQAFPMCADLPVQGDATQCVACLRSLGGVVNSDGTVTMPDKQVLAVAVGPRGTCATRCVAGCPQPTRHACGCTDLTGVLGLDVRDVCQFFPPSVIPGDAHCQSSYESDEACARAIASANPAVATAKGTLTSSGSVAWSVLLKNPSGAKDVLYSVYAKPNGACMAHREEGPDPHEFPAPCGSATRC